MPIRHHISEPAVRVIRRLAEAGYEAYVVGGAVRDILMDREPKDYDIATSATPEEVKEVFRRQARIIGRRFRLAHVRTHGETLEVSTFRREPTEEERKGRPEDDGVIVWRDNEYGTLEEDAKRRDFTVNAIFFDPLNEDGRFIDPVGGLKDLEDGIVRTIGDPAVRMAEDPVRMLRACKLVGQYGFTLDEPLAEAIRSDPMQLELSSRARLLEELFKILKRPFNLPIFTACREYGLLAPFLPSLDAEWNTAAGEFCRHCLEIRDEQLANDKLYPSRVTGLATIVLPFFSAEYGDGQVHELWENFYGVNKEVRQFVRDFLEPHRMPRFVMAKTVDVLLLQPKMLLGKGRNKILQHPEYNRGREVFLVFAKAAKYHEEVLQRWPRKQKSQKKKGKRRGGGRRRRRSSGKGKKQQS